MIPAFEMIVLEYSYGDSHDWGFLDAVILLVRSSGRIGFANIDNGCVYVALTTEDTSEIEIEDYFFSSIMRAGEFSTLIWDCYDIFSS